MNWMRSALVLVCAALLLSTAQAGAVNINTADVHTISRELEGVSEPLAQRIVQHRQQNGPFRSPRDLSQVPYVGDALLQRNQGSIRYE